MKNSVKNTIASIVPNTIVITPENYGKLVLLGNNRDIVQNHVTTMFNSVKRNNVLRDVIVVFDKLSGLYKVVDGQHLWHALMLLKLPITCRVANCDANDMEAVTKLMIDLNTASKSWTFTTYIECWAKTNNPQYNFLKVMIDMNNDIQSTVVLMAYARKSRTLATKQVKEGNFEVVDRPYGDKLINSIRECNKYVPSTRPINQALIELMVSVEKYDHKKMIKALKENKNLELSHKESIIFKQLLNLYNS